MPAQTQPQTGHSPEFDVAIQPGGIFLIGLKGDWLMRLHPPGVDQIEDQIEDGLKPAGVQFDASKVQSWDSGLVSFILKARALCRRLAIPILEGSLPMGLARLIHLAEAVPETEDAARSLSKPGFLTVLGRRSLAMVGGAVESSSFLGANVIAFLKLLRGKAQFRWSDALLAMQQCGPEALGVVALINFLVGVILAFVGAVQLRQFGAQIYVADLVAIGTVREMGCIMTGVILCGRTGAAFAAQLGAMKVNEEIDAFKTFAISPIEFLVLPRMTALLLMMPLLCVFADLISILGGFMVSISMLDVTSTEYINRTIQAITLKSFLLGIFKGAFFGIVVAISGCLRGIQCGTNAAAVGQATTSAVVTGITTIVAADGLFAVLCNALGI